MTRLKAISMGDNVIHQNLCSVQMKIATIIYFMKAANNLARAIEHAEEQVNFECQVTCCHCRELRDAIESIVHALTIVKEELVNHSHSIRAICDDRP